jgi:peptidoglycan hydrolase-like protein with peptidoglycan-binding domain
VAAAVALVAGGAELFGGAAAAQSRTVPTATARIVRTDVVERQPASGTLGFSGSFTVFAGSPGVVTWVPAPGQVVRRDDALFELDRRPVLLLYGARPAFREFASGMAPGGDVLELKRNLRALGFISSADDRFNPATREAVKEWQRSLHLPGTGRIPLGSVAFLPQAVRVAPAVTAGATVQPGATVLTATSLQRAVLVPLDPGTTASLRKGDPVVVTMPDGSSVSGRVASVGRVATPASQSQGDNGQGPPPVTVPVTVTLAGGGGGGGLDQAPVQVAITSAADRHVLAVPIAALLAQPDGGYAVDVPGRGTVRVRTGLFDDVAGRVEVAGRGLRPGMRVEVPTP